MRRITSILSAALFSFFTYSSSAQINMQKADRLFFEHAQGNGPGLAIKVTKNGDVLYENYVGKANLSHQIPISDTSRFLVGSISKQFTAYAILLLEEDGKLSIDDPITKYLPEFKGLEGDVTLRMLANHTSGFRNNGDLNEMRGRFSEDFVGNYEMVDMLLRQKHLNFNPGDQFQYNNTGYILLAEIVRRVSGMTFPEFVERNIFQPLKMENSLFFDNSTRIIKNKVDSYFITEDGVGYVAMNRSIVGSTGLYTTVSDLTLWAENFQNSRIGTEAIVQKMIAPSKLNSGVEIPYGLGLETKSYRGLKVIFHGGGDAGFIAYLLTIPEHNFTVAVTGNYESFNPLDVSYGMIDLFLADDLITGAPIEIPKLTSQQMMKYEGTYQVFPGTFIDIVMENDSLFMQSTINPDGRTYLPVIGDNVFSYTPRQHSEMVFSEGKLDWHFSDFVYPAKKVKLNPPSSDEIHIDDYLGNFYSDALQTSYRFEKQDDKIVITHPYNGRFELFAIAEDIFVTHSSTVSRIEFKRDGQQNVVACTISSQKAHNVRFDKYCR